MKRSTHSKHTGLSNISKKSNAVAAYYDNWASNYNETLADWRYDAPEQIASILRTTTLSPKSVILDVGCGTGLSGKALQAAGFTLLDGIDISRRSLEMADMNGTYRTLREMDLQQFPFPIPDDQYDGLVCVGVLTYLTDSINTLREFCRIVKSGGVVAVTQRNDLFLEREFQSILKGLFDEGMIAEICVSEPRSYLPDNEEFGDQLLVHYISYTVV